MRFVVRISIVISILSLIMPIPTPARAAGTIVVNTTDDGIVDDEDCSLREALQAAAALSGASTNGDCTGGGADPDTITFNIPTDGSDPGYNAGTGVSTILLGGASGVASNVPVIIDGTTQSNWTTSSGPVIELRSDDTMSSANLTFSDGSDGSTVKALMLTHAKYYAIYVGTGADGVSITGCYIMTDGTSQQTNTTSPIGIKIQQANNTVIGGPAAADRNLISGHTGVQIDGGSFSTIQGNYFGLQADGLTPIVNQDSTSAGILTEVNGGIGPSYNVIRDNVIAGFNTGIKIDIQSDHATVAGNKVGVAADGITDRGMSRGIHIWGADSNTIGGTTAADRNIVAGNSYSQIEIDGSGTDLSDSNLIIGNYVGVDATGESAVEPASPAMGIYVQNGSGNQVGGLGAGEGNVISGIGAGVGLLITSSETSNTVVRGNKIGTDKDGTDAIPNQTGISIGNTVVDIGDIIDPGANLISGNSAYGIFINQAAAAGATIVGNKIGPNADGVGAITGTPTTRGIFLGNGVSARVTNNWIGWNGTNGLELDSSSTLDATSDGNCFTGNGTYGAKSANSITPAALSTNWWGDASGPTHSGNPGGSGDAASDNVDYSSYMGSAPTTCSPFASLSLSSLDFGSQLVGTASAAQSIQLSNLGGKLMTISSISKTGPFTIAGGDCPTGGGTLKPAASCTVQVKFAPKAAGAVSGSLIVNSDSFASPDVVTLTGAGAAGTQLLKNTGFEIDANLDTKPDNWKYGNFVAGIDAQDCTVHKAGSCSLRLSGNGVQKTVTKTVKKTGVAGDDFTFSLWSKADLVPAGSVYKLQVKFYNGGTLEATKTMKFGAGTHGFKQVKGTFTASSAYTKIVYTIAFKAASGTAWFDSASLKWAP